MFQIFALSILLVLPTSQPTTRQSVESDLRRIVVALRQQVADLRAENTSLKKQVQDLQAHPPAAQTRPIQPTSPDIAEQLHEGMTKAEVLDVMDRQPDSEQTGGGIEQLTWKFKRPRTPDENRGAYHGVQVDPRSISISGGNTEDPAAPTIPSGEVTVFLRNGKVAEVRKAKY